MEYINCNLCHNDDTKLLFTAQDINYGIEGSFNIVKCKRCGLVYLNPRPTKEELNKYYPKEYFGIDSPDLKSASPDFPRMKKIIAFKKKGKILDIGCKRGELLAAFKESGWETLGIDISPLAADFARKRLGLNIITADLLETNLPAESFDVVSLEHSLEHLSLPRETLREVNRLLKRDGLLYIGLPNFDSFQARIFKDKWFHLDVPRHLFHFSPKTIGILLEKTGFQVQTINHFSLYHNYVGLRMSLLNFLRMHRHYSLTKEKKLTEDKFSFLKFIFNNCCKYFSILENHLKHGGTIEVYAKKLGAHNVRGFDIIGVYKKP